MPFVSEPNIRRGLVVLGLLAVAISVYLRSSGWFVSAYSRLDEPPPASESEARTRQATVTWVNTERVKVDAAGQLRNELRLNGDIDVVVRAPIRKQPEDPETLLGWARKQRPGASPEDLRTTITSLVPYIDGIEIKGVTPTSLEVLPPTAVEQTTIFHYRLTRDEDNEDAWSRLLGRPWVRGETRTVKFTLGTDTGEVLPTVFDSTRKDAKDPNQLQLVLIVAWWPTPFVVLVWMLLWFMVEARYGSIIRDASSGLPPKQQPYSLARLQMAVWLFVVVGSYMLIWMISHDRGDVPTNVLILLGISGTTALGAGLIDDDSPRARLNAEIAADQLRERELAARLQATPNDPQLARQHAELAARIARKEAERLEKFGTKGIVTDLLRDGNGTGLHRLQMLLWTGVFAVIFVVTVSRDLSMPEFSESMLGLMGISAGTYLGFKRATNSPAHNNPPPPASPPPSPPDPPPPA